MQREHSPDGSAQSAAPYEPARGPDGRFIAQRALQVADYSARVTHRAETAGSPFSAWNWLKPGIGVLASLLTSVASEVSGAITATDQLVPGTAVITDAATTADGTLNASFLSVLAAADNRLSTCGLVPDVAELADATTTAAGAIHAPSRLFAGAASRFLTCPLIPNLSIERCAVNIPRMPVRRLTELGMGCLHSPQSGDTCNICLCAMFHANPALQDTVHALDEMLRRNITAGEVISAQMLEERPFIDYVTNPDPFGGVKDLPSSKKVVDWQEAMVRIMETLNCHAEGLNLPAVAKQFIRQYPYLVTGLGGLGVGVSAFAVYWFLKWLLKTLVKMFLRLRSADRGVNVDLEAGINVDLEAGVNEKQEAELEESPTDDTPCAFAENTTITLVNKRITGCKKLLQYRFHVENQPHGADNWASMSFLTELFGSQEALREAIKKYDSMSLPWDPQFLPRVATVTKEQVRMFRIGKVWF